MEYNPIRQPPSPSEPLPPYSTTWGNDFVQHGNEKSRKGSVAWRSTYDTVQRRVSSVTMGTWPFLRDKAWPMLKRFRFTKKQSYAFLLVLVCGVTPILTVGVLTSNYEYNRPFYGVFAAKTISCGDALGAPQNSTVSGWEALFALDFTFGDLPFSQAKIVDVAWDLVVGRGVQLLAWWASYITFNDALLRVIERQPTAYRTFQHIGLNGGCWSAIWALLKDLGRTKSKRTWSLYIYMVLSTLYVLSIPLILSAMTGYTSVSFKVLESAAI